MFKDPLIRRFISASLFAGAFVWVAVVFFDVETEVVWVFLILSVVFVLMMVFAGLILAPIVSLFNRRPPLLGSLEKGEEGTEDSEEISSEDRSS